MKKIFALFVPLLALIGCTLSIEDELPQPEEIGFDEPVTVENEYGSLTYQFNDSVLYVTERVQEHITMIDDSTLFYDGSTPKEWRPYVGSKLAAGVSHLIPGGLNNRVVSVTQQDGGYLVKTVRTTVEDVYKELEYEFDVDNTMPYVTGEESDEELRALGYERLADSTLMYWGFYDKQRAKALGIKTRGGGSEDDPEELGAEDVVEANKQDTLFDITFDTRKIIAFAKAYWAFTDIVSFLHASLNNIDDDDGFERSAVFNLMVSCNTKTHVKKVQSTEYEENWTDSYFKISFGTEVGFSQKIDNIGPDVKPENVGKSAGWMMKSVVQNPGFRKDVDLLKDYYSKNGHKIKSPSGEKKFAFFMLGPLPINFVFRYSTDPTLEFSGAASAKFVATTDTKRVGYIIKDGAEYPVDEVVKPGVKHLENIGVQGEFKVGFAARAAIGVEVAGTVGFDIGVNLDIAFSAKGEYDLLLNDQSKCNDYKLTGNVSFTGDFFGDFRIYVAPLGMNVWDKNWIFAKKRLFEFSSSFEPTVKSVYSYMVPKLSDEVLVRGSVIYKDMGYSRCLFTSKDATSQMRLYFGDFSEKSKDFVVMTPIDKDNNPLETISIAVENNEYFYEWQGPVPEGVTHCTLVPYVEVDKTEAVLCSDYAQPVELGVPDISIVADGTKQTYGGENLDFTGEVDGFIDQNADGSGYGASVDPSTLRQYRFATQAAVRNGSYLQKWGIKVEVFTPDGKRSVSKKIPMNPNKTGIYTLICTFFTNWQKLVSGDPVPMQFRVTPYWVDSQGVSHKGKASAKMPIEYECADITPETSLGFVVEKDL